MAKRGLPGARPGRVRSPDVDPASETPRQRLTRWLAHQEHDFEDLRSALDLSARQLESELRHVQRSARGSGARLHIEPPRCRDCGFGFPGREARHLHPPSRCPRCRSQRIAPPRFRLVSRAP